MAGEWYEYDTRCYRLKMGAGDIRSGTSVAASNMMFLLQCSEPGTFDPIAELLLFDPLMHSRRIFTESVRLAYTRDVNICEAV